MADNMSADLTVQPLLAARVLTSAELSASLSFSANLAADVSSQAGLLGSAKTGVYLMGNAGSNVLFYDDPIDYLMFESGIRMRTEADIYMKTEASQ